MVKSSQSQLTASSRSLHEQKALLEKKTSKAVLQRMNDDASSLVCLRDSTSFTNSHASWMSCSSETSSRISKEFEFDHDVQSSRVYQNHFRSLIRRHTRETKSHGRQRLVVQDAVDLSEESQINMTVSSAINTYETSAHSPHTMPASPSSSHRRSRSSSTATIRGGNESIKMKTELEEEKSNVTRVLPQENDERQYSETQGVMLEPSDIQVLKRDISRVSVTDENLTIDIDSEDSPLEPSSPMYTILPSFPAVPGNTGCGILPHLCTEAATSDAEHLDRLNQYDCENPDVVPTTSPITTQALEAHVDAEMSGFDFQIGRMAESCSSSQISETIESGSIGSYCTCQISAHEAGLAVTPQEIEVELRLLNLLITDIGNADATETIGCQFCHLRYMNIDSLRHQVRNYDIDSIQRHDFDFGFDSGSEITSDSTSKSLSEGESHFAELNRGTDAIIVSAKRLGRVYLEYPT